MATDIVTAFAACLFIGIATGYAAKAKNRSAWRWGPVGFFIFGPIIHTVVGILVAFFFFS